MEERAKQKKAPKPRRDLSGMRFGLLTVLEYVRDEKGNPQWKCQCDCGTITYRTTGHLNETTVSCGCQQRKDLIGKRFGKLMVLEKTTGRKSGAVIWKCRCDCGNLCEKNTSELNCGLAVSCGCSWRQPAVHAGERYGRLMAIRPLEKRSAQSIVWECQCDCGTIANVRATLLTSGHTTSCGCVKKELDEQRDFKKVLTYTDDTCIEFAENIGKPSALTSLDTGVRGVILINGKYVAQITFRKKRYYLGSYSQIDDAVRARKQAENKVKEYVQNYYSENPNSSKIDFEE